jgi:hypothetical protein
MTAGRAEGIGGIHQGPPPGRAKPPCKTSKAPSGSPAADGRVGLAGPQGRHTRRPRVRVELTGPANSGDSVEKAVLRKSAEAGRTDVKDRRFGQFALLDAIALECPDLHPSYVEIQSFHRVEFFIAK